MFTYVGRCAKPVPHICEWVGCTYVGREKPMFTYVGRCAKPILHICEMGWFTYVGRETAVFTYVKLNSEKQFRTYVDETAVKVHKGKTVFTNARR